MSSRARPERNGRPFDAEHAWLVGATVGRAVAIVGSVGDELILSLRRADPTRVEFVTHETLQADQPPDDVRADFDVVIVEVDGSTDEAEIRAAEGLARRGGRVLLVVRSRHADLPGEDEGVADDERDRYEARLEHLERRRAAVLDELVASEQALSRAEALADAASAELKLMRRTVSWRLTRPLRWVRKRARE